MKRIRHIIPIMLVALSLAGDRAKAQQSTILIPLDKADAGACYDFLHPELMGCVSTPVLDIRKVIEIDGGFAKGASRTAVLAGAMLNSKALVAALPASWGITYRLPDPLLVGIFLAYDIADRDVLAGLKAAYRFGG